MYILGGAHYHLFRLQGKRRNEDGTLNSPVWTPTQWAQILKNIAQLERVHNPHNLRIPRRGANKR